MIKQQHSTRVPARILGDTAGHNQLQHSVGTWASSSICKKRLPRSQVATSSSNTRNAKLTEKKSKYQGAIYRRRLASRSDSRRVNTSPSRTGPFTLRIMLRWVSSRNSTRTWVTCPRDPVRPRILVTFACLIASCEAVSAHSATYSRLKHHRSL